MARPATISQPSNWPDPLATPPEHWHPISQVTELQATLNDKAALDHTHEGTEGIPSGVICMWAGALVAIPSGWVLCDGTAGTPDLRSMFIKGAAAGQNPGGSGGAATHSHTTGTYAVSAHTGTAVADHAALGTHAHGVGTLANAWPAGVPTFSGSTLGAHAHGAGTLAPNAHSGTAVDDHASHTHTYTQIVNHTHPVIDPGHTHLTRRYPTATGSSSGFTIDTSMSGTIADNTLPTKIATTGVTTDNPAGGVATGTTNVPSATLTHSVTQPATHTMSGSSEAISGGTPAGTIAWPAGVPALSGSSESISAGTPSAHDVTQPAAHSLSGASNAVNHEPAYYALAFIMKS